MKTGELTALLGSRICHDLISPLGAIGNGVELLEMSGVVAGPEMSLITESISSASARIRFFRVAYGAAAAGQALPREEIVAILGRLSAGSRISYDWTPPGPAGRVEAKLAFLAIQCLETGMPRGGRITVLADGPRWTVSAAGERIRIDTGKWALLSRAGPAPGTVTAADVQFVLLALAAEDFARELDVRTSETEASIAFRPVRDAASPAPSRGT